MRLLCLLAALQFITACGQSAETDADINAASSCQSVGDSAACGQSSFGGIGCYWNTTPGTGQGSGCLTISQCSQAVSMQSCQSASLGCQWNNGSCAQASSTPILQQNGCYNAVSPVSLKDCVNSYQPQFTEEIVFNCPSLPCPATQCAVFSLRNVPTCGPTYPCTASYAELCTAVSGCVWKRESPYCAVAAPLLCTNIGGQCCPLGSASCAQTDPNCIQTSVGGNIQCTDRAVITCTPNDPTNPTACCAGSATDCTASSVGCILLNNEQCYST